MPTIVGLVEGATGFFSESMLGFAATMPTATEIPAYIASRDCLLHYSSPLALYCTVIGMLVFLVGLHILLSHVASLAQIEHGTRQL